MRPAVACDGVSAWRVEHQAPISANSMVYETPEGIPVLTDTPWTPMATADLLDWVELRFGALPAAAVIGHYHLDASGGISALRAAGVPVVASAHTAQLLAEAGPGMQERLAESYGAAFEGWGLSEPDVRFDSAEGWQQTIGGAEMRVIFPGHAHAQPIAVVVR